LTIPSIALTYDFRNIAKESKRVQANAVFIMLFQKALLQDYDHTGFAHGFANALKGFGLIKAQVFEHLSSKKPSAECVIGFYFSDNYL
jgi:hypothetical protein